MTDNDDYADDDAPAPSNCTDETKRDYYRKALMAKIALEAAQDEVRSKNGQYRSILKDAKKAGVDSEAITKTLAARFTDHDELVLQLREQLKMLDLAGVVPNIIDKILNRLDIEEPTANEAHQTALDRAYDDGVRAASAGAAREENPHTPGSEEGDAWYRGFLWLAGQRKLAEDMAPVTPPTAIPNVTAAVKANLRRDAMPAEPPAPVH